jgi:hypothetical protein
VLCVFLACFLFKPDPFKLAITTAHVKNPVHTHKKHTASQWLIQISEESNQYKSEIDWIDAGTHTYTHTQTHIYLHTHIFTHTHIYIYTHTHTQRNTDGWMDRWIAR